MRPYPGLTAERVDFESAVVGERRGMRALEIKARLDTRVLLERRAGLFRHVTYSSVGERYEIQLEIAQQQPILGKFRGIGGRDQQPSHRYLVESLARRFGLIGNLKRSALATFLERQ